MRRGTKLRKDIPEKDRWDLTLIYKNEELWEKDYLKCEEAIKEISTLKDVITSSRKLLEFLNLYFNTHRLIEKLGQYASLSLATNHADIKYQILDERINQLDLKLIEKTAFFEPEILKLNYQKIGTYYQEEPKLLDYQKYLKNIFRYQKHILNKEQEEILSSLGNILENAHNNYVSFFDADLKFPSFKVDGKTVRLTESNYLKYLTSPDRKTRQKVFKLMYKTLGSYKNTVTSMLNGHLEVNNKIAKIRNFNSVLESCLFGDEINSNIYDNFINTISDNLEPLFLYYDLKKQILELNDFQIYDLYVPIVKDLSKEYEFEEAKDIIIKALQPLGKDYLNDLNKAFTERWIDIYHNEGKSSGAYSSGSYDTVPYILLNFEKQFNDVSTLIHELGHSMHSYYSKANNIYPNYHYRILVAEIASTVNELLLTKYLLNNTKNKHEKLNILNRQLELYKSTIYRQMMFSEFEKGIYDYQYSGQVITYEYLCNYYYNLNKKYFGNHIIIDELIKYEWMRVDHFFYDFYVYKYVLGLTCATYVVERLFKDPTYLSKYLKFLSLGGSMPPLEELKVIDIDLHQKDVIESAITYFKDTLTEFAKTYKEIGEINE